MDVRSTLLAAAVAGSLALPVNAAPFVAGMPQTLSQRIADARAAVIVGPAGDDDGERWKVVTVLNDSTGTVAVGQMLEPRPAPPSGAVRALLISNRDRSVFSCALSEAGSAYLDTLPKGDAPLRDRLACAVAHLAETDALIAADVFAVLAGFSHEEFREARDLLRPEPLRAVIGRSETLGHRLGLYAYLLGMCGTTDDERALRSLFMSAEPPMGADGVAAGYLLLAGEDGLADLETHVLMTEHTSPLLAAGVLDAIRFLRSCDDPPLPVDRLRQAACCGLARRDVADLSIGHLAAAREWSVLPEIVRLLEPDDTNTDRHRSCQVAVVRYLLECRRDQEASLEQRRAAARVLDGIAASDGDLMRRASILSGEPPPRH